MGDFLYHEPCPQCGSEDNLARYSDGGAHCFSSSCDYYERADEDFTPQGGTKKHKSKRLPPLGEFGGLPPSWRISEETCKKMRYSVGSYMTWNHETEERDTHKAHIVHVPDQDGKPVASKIRMAGKEFRYVGETKAAGLVFQDVWPAGCSRKIVVTEGEKDALAVCEIQGRKYPVVSLPNGTKSAAEVCGRSRDYLSSFEDIILMFDMDEPGREAAREVSQLFPYGKAKIAELPRKDAHDCLVNGDSRAVINAVFNAQPWSPAGIVTLSSLKEEMKKPVEWGRPWFYEQLTKLTYGRREGELYFIGAGVAVGKTDFILGQVEHDLHAGELSTLFMLEQPCLETGKRLAGKWAGKMFHLPPDAGGYKQDELDRAVDEVAAAGDLMLYNHFGAKDWGTIEETIRYLAVAAGRKHFWIDHLTALVAQAEDERRAIEQITERMSSICQELSINLYVISHLATPEGKPHEEGGRVAARHFKGSRAIAQWAHFMFGLERNTQADDRFVRSVGTFRVCKDRYTGKSTGETFLTGFDATTGRTFELDGEECDKYHELLKGGDARQPSRGGRSSEDF